MLKLPYDIFDKLSEDDRSVALMYVKKDYISKIDIIELGGQRYLISASLIIDIKHYDLHFIYDEALVDIESFSCDCPWGKKGRLCAHIGAVIYWLLMHEIDSVPFRYDREGYHADLQRRLLEEKRSQEIKNGIIKTKILLKKIGDEELFEIRKELQSGAYFIIPSLRWIDDSLTMHFEIYDKDDAHYLIRNLPKFLEDIDNVRFHSYGKKMSFFHSYDSFSPTSKKYIDFIRWYYQTSSYIYYYPYSYIEIDDEVLEHYYELFKNEATSLILEDELKLTMTLREDHDVFILKIDTDLSDLRFTDTDIFKITQVPSIKHLKASKAMQRLLQEQKTDQEIFIAKDDMSALYRLILADDKENLKIDDPSGILKSIAKKSPNKIEVYGDIYDNDTLLFKVSAKDIEDQTISAKDIDKEDRRIKIIDYLLKEDAISVDEDELYYYMDADSDKTFSFIKDKLERLQKYATVYISDDIRKLKKKAHYKIQAGVRMRSGLLEIDLDTLDFDISEISNILSSYRKKKRYHKLKNGETISLDSDELKELDELLFDLDIDPKKIKNGRIELENYRALSIEKDLDRLYGFEIDKDGSLKEYIDGFKKMKSKKRVSTRYNDILRDYQIYGVNWLLTLYRYGLNGILADEMGLGKTIQVIALLETIKAKGRHSIVICPSSLIYNWENEIKRFDVDLSYTLILGSKSTRKRLIDEHEDHDLLITSYDYLRRDIELYEGKNFEYVILDEAQNIKNQKTKNATSVKALRCAHRLALSGTPIENSLAELWSIFDFLMPSYLFSYAHFKREFETPIIMGNDKDSANKLKEMVSPFILRRTKKEVLKELPDKVDHKYLIEFTDEEKDIYLANLAQVSKEMRIKIKEPRIDHIAILAMLTRLRQLCCDQRLVYDGIDHPSSKIEACVDLLSVLHENKKKTLVFSSFTSLIDLIKDELDKNKISYYILTGSTSKEERQRLVDAFQTDDTAVFLISLKAGGTGLNLTAAEAVIHVDPWWNVSAQNQATDRAHRIGQNANVQVYRMIMKDSIEEKIVKMQEHKKDLADSFIEGNDGSLAKMSKEEIIELFQR